MDAAHSLVADAENALGVGHQQQLGRSVAAGLAQQLHQPLLLGRRQVHPLAGAAVGGARLLDRPAHRGGVHDRHHQLDVVGQEAVEEGEVALPQALGVGVALQIAAHRLEGPPAAIHLLSEAFFLPGQQDFEAQIAALLAAEGRAFVEEGVVEQIGAPQGRGVRSRGDGGWGRIDHGERSGGPWLDGRPIVLWRRPQPGECPSASPALLVLVPRMGEAKD